MNREQNLDSDSLEFFNSFRKLHDQLDAAFLRDFDQSLPTTELLIDRWERAERLGFERGASICDSAFVFGAPSVGESSWIGPFTILDGSGGLVIGANCTISSGVHIYSHDNVKKTLSPNLPIDRQPVSIGNNVYVGPNTIITKGVSIGDYCVIGAYSFVNKSFESNSIIMGQPAKVVGRVKFDGQTPILEYYR